MANTRDGNMPGTPPNKADVAPSTIPITTVRSHGHLIQVYYEVFSGDDSINNPDRLIEFGKSVGARMDESSLNKVLHWWRNPWKSTLYRLHGNIALFPLARAGGLWQVIRLGLWPRQEAADNSVLKRGGVLLSFK